MRCFRAPPLGKPQVVLCSGLDYFTSALLAYGVAAAALRRESSGSSICRLMRIASLRQAPAKHRGMSGDDKESYIRRRTTRNSRSKSLRLIALKRYRSVLDINRYGRTSASQCIIQMHSDHRAIYSVPAKTAQRLLKSCVGYDTHTAERHQDQVVARSGTIDWRLDCATCWS
jgi:hypothetical protein